MWNVFLWLCKTYFSENVKCVSHLHCGARLCYIFKISTQQLINWALSGLSISGRNSTSLNICPSSSSSSSSSLLNLFLIFLSCSSLYQSWVSQVCPVSSVVGLEPMFIFAGRHSYIRPSCAPPNVHTLKPHLCYCYRGNIQMHKCNPSNVRQYAQLNMLRSAQMPLKKRASDKSVKFIFGMLRRCNSLCNC